MAVGMLRRERFKIVYFVQFLTVIIVGRKSNAYMKVVHLVGAARESKMSIASSQTHGLQNRGKEEAFLDQALV